MNTPSTPLPPSGVTDCEPDIQAATSTLFYSRNRRKKRNFIMAEVTGTGYFDFYVENLPKDGTGCPGWWLFQLAWDHFVVDQRVTIKGVRGDWTTSDNLDVVNALTAGNQMTLEDASRRTWTYRQASAKGFTAYQYIDAQ